MRATNLEKTPVEEPESSNLSTSGSWIPGNLLLLLLHYRSTIAIHDHETMQETTPYDQNSFAPAVLSTRQSQQRCSFPTAPKTNLREPVSAVGTLQLPQQCICPSQHIWEKTCRLQPEMAVQKGTKPQARSQSPRTRQSCPVFLPQLSAPDVHTTSYHYHPLPSSSSTDETPILESLTNIK